MGSARSVWWTLRVGAALCFIGHGAFGIITKEAWLPFFGLAGIGREVAFDPHRLAVDTIGGVERVISLALVRDSAAGVWAAYGVDAPPKALDSLFHDVARKQELLPRALVGAILTTASSPFA